MNCQKCVGECEKQGGLCGIIGRDEREGLHDMGMKDSDIDAHVKEHRASHTMAIQGHAWVCLKGHRVEAAPADAMRAAGMEPML